MHRAAAVDTCSLCSQDQFCSCPIPLMVLSTYALGLSLVYISAHLPPLPFLKGCLALHPGSQTS